LPEDRDPVFELEAWAKNKLQIFNAQGLARERVILDPGIGFGKTRLQNFEILRRVDELLTLEVRWLVGHSRKSFLNDLTGATAAHRDLETIGISLSLAHQGVDYLRVHNIIDSIRAFRGFSHVSKQ
jgi:dihydropteroate synthase